MPIFDSISATLFAARLVKPQDRVDLSYSLCRLVSPGCDNVLDTRLRKSRSWVPGVGRDLGVGVGLVATVTTQRVVNGNNFVTFQISRAALFGAILSSNKHINTYEND